MWRVHREVTNETYAVFHTMTLTTWATWANKTSLFSLRGFNCLNNKQYNVFNYKTNQTYKDTKVLIHSANKTLKILFTLTVPLYFLRKKTCAQSSDVHNNSNAMLATMNLQQCSGTLGSSDWEHVVWEQTICAAQQSCMHLNVTLLLHKPNLQRKRNVSVWM